jgi:hypothetical protein
LETAAQATFKSYPYTQQQMSSLVHKSQACSKGTGFSLAEYSGLNKPEVFVSHLKMSKKVLPVDSKVFHSTVFSTGDEFIVDGAKLCTPNG